MILIVAGVGIIILLVLLLVLWRRMPEKRDYGVKLTFNEFISYYNLNPDRYKISDCRFPNRSHPHVGINFGFISYYRYVRWVKRKSKKEAAQRADEEVLRLIKIVQEDIDKIRAQAQAERDSAERVAREVLERLKGDEERV
jgi:hypothetical protein